MPSEPYFPKIVPIVGAAFVASLLIMAIVTLLQELFSGRAMRPAPGARFDPVADVEMPARALTTKPSRRGESTASRRRRRSPAEPAPSSRADAGSRAEAEPARPSIGEISVERAAEKLIAGGAARAIFVSPEGDEAAATAVLVAREVADAGLRVLLLDLTASGAASRPMLDSMSYPGITNLLASEAQFADVIHADLYSDCHVIPVGTADPARAMRAADRLPIIMESLTTAYDVVVVECGPADAEGIRRLVADGTEILVSVLEPDAEVAEAAEKPRRPAAIRGVTLVTPAGHEPPHVAGSGTASAPPEGRDQFARPGLHALSPAARLRSALGELPDQRAVLDEGLQPRIEPHRQRQAAGLSPSAARARRTAAISMSHQSRL